MDLNTANRLVDFRKKAGLSQEELADKLGVSRQAVSKWERGEASPDTDNLIALAKLYGVSLDELVGNEINKENNGNFEENKEEKSEKYVRFSLKDGIHVHDGEDTVDIDSSGIHVVEKDGDKVHISSNGINIKDKDDDVIFGDDLKRKGVLSLITKIVESSVALAVVVAYLAVGFAYKGTLGTTNVSAWAGLWPMFILIPFPGSIFHAIKDRKFSHVAIPLLVTGIYCFVGMLLGLWHPCWVLFLIIPLYYSLFSSIDHYIHKKH